jgi:hypothetical protein
MTLETKCRQFFGRIIHLGGYFMLFGSVIFLIVGVVFAVKYQSGLFFLYFFLGFVGCIISGLFSIGFGDMMVDYDRLVLAKLNALPATLFAAKPAASKKPEASRSNSRPASFLDPEADEIIERYRLQGFTSDQALIEHLEQESALGNITVGDLERVKKRLGF